MKSNRFAEEQIIGILQQAEAGAKTADLCREHGLGEATFYKGKAQYGGLQVSDAQKLKRLEEENTKLKRVVADLTLDNVALKGLLKKMVEQAAQKAAVNHLVEKHQRSERRACRLVNLCRSTQRYCARPRPDDGLRQRVSE
jgi:putative transposase